MRAALESPLNNLWFVEARMLAKCRTDGHVVPAEEDNPACFFLHTDRGWMLATESMWPELPAIRQRLVH